MTNSGWTVLDLAHNALRAAVAAVDADQWTLPTPCSAWTVAQVFQHALGDQQAYAGSLTGAGFPEDNPFAPSGVLAGDPVETLERALTATAAAYSAVPVDDPAVAVPLPHGPLHARVAAGAAALDAAVHGWDLAVATGRRPLLDDGLAGELLAVAAEIVEPVRAFAFAPALPTVAADGPTATLLKFLGRDPAWSPTP